MAGFQRCLSEGLFPVAAEDTAGKVEEAKHLRLKGEGRVPGYTARLMRQIRN